MKDFRITITYRRTMIRRKTDKTHDTLLLCIMIRRDAPYSCLTAVVLERGIQQCTKTACGKDGVGYSVQSSISVLVIVNKMQYNQHTTGSR